MNELKRLQKIAAITISDFEKKEKDPRVRKAIGKLIAAGILKHNFFKPYHGAIEYEDLLRAGEVEPRVYELLPALVLKKPKFARGNLDMASDLKEIVNQIRKGTPTKDFRGVPPKQYMQWIPRLGHENKLPTLLKTFRFTQEDIKLIEDIKKKTKMREIEIVRKAIRNLYLKVFN